MNFLTDKWLPVIRQDGSYDRIAITDMLSEYENNPVIDINVPLPELRSGAYHILIGLLNIAHESKNDTEWSNMFNRAMTEDDFKTAFEPLIEYFNIDGEGIRFMQGKDLEDEKLPKDIEVKEEPIMRCIADGVSENSEKKNTDILVKRDDYKQVSPYWACVLLYQCTMFGKDGGGSGNLSPLFSKSIATMVTLSDDSTLWQRLWVNTLTKDDTVNMTGIKDGYELCDVFSWTSSVEGSKERTISQHTKPVFYCYFPMPSFRRLLFTAEKGKCDLTGDECDIVVKSYLKGSKCTHYDMGWRHPLYPTQKITKKGKTRIDNISSNKIGMTFNNWLGNAIEYGEVTKGRFYPSYLVEVTKNSIHRLNVLDHKIALTVTGLGGSNGKFTQWIESTQPCVLINDEYIDTFTNCVNYSIGYISDVLKVLPVRIYRVLSRNSVTTKGDIMKLQSTYQIQQTFLSKIKENFDMMINDVVNEPNQIVEHSLKLIDTVTSEINKTFAQYVLRGGIRGDKLYITHKNALRDDINKIRNSITKNINQEKSND